MIKLSCVALLLLLPSGIVAQELESEEFDCQRINQLEAVRRQLQQRAEGTVESSALTLYATGVQVGLAAAYEQLNEELPAWISGMSVEMLVPEIGLACALHPDWPAREATVDALHQVARFREATESRMREEEPGSPDLSNP
jgi:hypothetical protein